MDDDEALRELSKAVLSTLGYDVQTAGDGAEAVELYAKTKAAGKGFDAVLLDLTVTGGIGGLETAAMLKQLDPVRKVDCFERVFRCSGHVPLCRIRLRCGDFETLDGERNERGSAQGAGCGSRSQKCISVAVSRTASSGSYAGAG